MGTHFSIVLKNGKWLNHTFSITVTASFSENWYFRFVLERVKHDGSCVSIGFGGGTVNSDLETVVSKNGVEVIAKDRNKEKERIQESVYFRLDWGNEYFSFVPFNGEYRL